VSPFFSQGVIVVITAVFGAMVGSFLNVCIYRLPLGLSVGNPVRSFCPGCERTIPWYQNIPVLSWLLLGGRCGGCRNKISPRYLVVEILTALLFAGVAARFVGSTPLLIVPGVCFVSLLVVATFVDLEHLIIPDEVTWGGVGAGIVFAFLLPELHATGSRFEALGWAALGASVGYGTLWLVAEGGRLVFGKSRFAFDPPVEAVWTRTGESAELVVDGEVLDWSGLFPRGTEVVEMDFTDGDLDGTRFEAVRGIWSFESLEMAGRLVDLNAASRLACRLRSLVLPREVMGYGDVKLLAAIGAFNGWKAVFFTLMAGSCAGAAFGLAALLVGRRAWSAKIPFGPYLAFGALLWLAVGEELWRMYWAVLSRAGAV